MSKKQQRGPSKTRGIVYVDNFQLDYTPHDFSEISDFIDKNAASWPVVTKPKRKYSDKIDYYNIAASIDIETSTFFWTLNGKQVSQIEKNQMEKKEQDALTAHACLTCWQIGLNGTGFIGRTWEDFWETLEIIKEKLNLDNGKRLIMYIHNLAYEFQWVRKWTHWDRVFAVSDRKPIHAYMSDFGIELKDSLILTGYKLEKVAENLIKYKVKKLVGDWDYTKIRTAETPLTEKEKGYALNDVLVVMAMVQEKIEEESYIYNIPLTNTGYVRRFCRKNTINSKDVNIAKMYKAMIDNLKITLPEYVQLKKTFSGGLTHANAMYAGEILENVKSFDLTSDYPSQMVMEKYPMGRAPDIEIKSLGELEEQCKIYCCMFHVKLYDVRPKINQENIISSSKCDVLKKPRVNNGRIVTADELALYVTEQDWYNIKDCYTFSGVEISEFVRYYKQYLPTPYVDTILVLYKAKTELKGVDEAVAEYMLKKGMLNAGYGMMVTDIINELCQYSGEKWLTPDDVDYKKTDPETEIGKYNKGYNRFLYYPWGVWVTAYARRTLVRAIVACGDNYVYSDTDSIKFIQKNSEKFEEWVKEYNLEVENKLRAACEYHRFDFDRVKPKTIKGKEKLLGVWDFDGEYSKFKTLGAKRYMYKEGEKLVTTVAGSNKTKTAEYVTSQKGKDPFAVFDDKMIIPAEKSGKSAHVYIDDEFGGVVTDYLGNQSFYREKSAVALVEIPFTIKMSGDYLQYLENVIRVDATI